jgi:hypothetical protein
MRLVQNLVKQVLIPKVATATNQNTLFHQTALLSVALSDSRIVPVSVFPPLPLAAQLEDHRSKYSNAV